MVIQPQSTRTFASFYIRWRNMNSAQHNGHQAIAETVRFSGRMGMEECQGGSIGQQGHSHSFLGCTPYVTYQKGLTICYIVRPNFRI